MAALLDSDSEPELRINPAYAQRYEQRKKKEELSQLQDKYGDGSESESSDDEEEDEVGELVTPAVDAQIVKTIALLRKRDPAVYDAEKKFFDDAEIEEAKRKWREKQQKLKEDGKPVKLKDFQRQRLLAGAEGESNDEEEEKPLTLAEEQEKARRELKVGREQAFDR